MASGIGGSAGATVKRKPTVKPPVPAVAPTGIGVTSGLKMDKPQPVLAKHGIQGGVETLNDKVKQITEAHQQALGYKPSPGLVYDLLRAAVPPDVLGSLFSGPSTLLHARAVGNAAKQKAVNGLGGGIEASAVEPVPVKPRSLDQATVEINRQHALGQITTIQAQNQLQALGVYGGRHLSQAQIFPPVQGVGGFAAKLIGQTVEGLITTPMGVYLASKAIGLDARDIATRRDLTPQRTEKLGVGMGKSFYADVTHPTERPGYLFLDALGVLAAGSGALARVGAAARAEGFAARASALTHRPLAGTFTIKQGGFTAEKLLSENAAVRQWQRGYYSILNRNLAKRETTREIAGADTGTMRGAARAAWDRQLGSEARLGREAKAADRVEQALRMSLVRELDWITGWSVVASRAFQRIARVAPDKVIENLPGTAKRGLSRGEQKAIQVLALDDPNPLATWQRFHQRMIDNADFYAKEQGIDPQVFVQNHERQLADLRLAEKVLTSQNPSKRFLRALDLTQQVVAEQQRMKIENLGLSANTAAARIAIEGEVVRLGRKLTDEERTRVREEVASGQREVIGFYSPKTPAAKTRKAPSGGTPFQARSGEFGVPNPALGERRALPELYHQFSGDSIIAGDFRIDATNLAAEAYGRTVRITSIWDSYNNLLSASSPTKRSVYDVPIREKAAIPDALRTRLLRIESGEFTGADAKSLAPNDTQAILNQLFPDPHEQIDGVRWVDSRLIQQTQRYQQMPGARALQVAQEIPRDLILYLRPAYILNLVGNVGMALVHQGPMSIPNTTRALFARQIYGDRIAARLQAIVGEGRSRSFVNPEADSAFTSVSRGMSQFWNRITDQDLRVSAMIHELRRNGVKTREEMQKVLFGEDPAAVKVRVEAARRAKKAMVEFDNLTWFEKSTLRNFIFVYPWVSRSAVWSIRTLFEHPIKTNLAVLAADQADEEWGNVLAKAPDWFKLSGYFPVNYDAEGRPMVVNPTSINTFSTLGEMMSVAQGTFLGDPNQSAVQDLLGPLPKIGFEAAQKGGGGLPGALKKEGVNLPQVATAKRLMAKPTPNAKPADRPVFIPGANWAYGPLLIGGLAAKTLDVPALTARWWKLQDSRTRMVHEGKIAVALEKVNAKVIGKPLPAQVRDAVDMATRVTLAQFDKAHEIGRTLTDLEKTQVLIQTLTSQARLTEDQATEFSNEATASVDGGKALRGRLMYRYANGKSLTDWHSEANTVLSFKDHEFGRRFNDYTLEISRLSKAAALTPSGPEQAVAYAKVGEYVARHPDLAAADWAQMDADQQAKHLLDISTKPWNWLGSFDKQLLGKKADEKVAHGWVMFEQLRADAIAKLPAGQKRLTSEYATTLAKYVNRYYADGFLQDYLFSRQPLVRRLQVLNVWQQSPNKDLWQQLLTVSGRYASYLANPDYSKSGVKDSWKTYVDTSLKPWLAQNPTFQSEIGQYGPQFLYKLLER